MKKFLIVIGVIAAIAALISSVFFSSEKYKRQFKSLKSNYLGGIDRCVTAYSLSGSEIKKWCGSFDMQESESQVFFDLKGKRVIIRGGVIISEEN